MRLGDYLTGVAMVVGLAGAGSFITACEKVPADTGPWATSRPVDVVGDSITAQARQKGSLNGLSSDFRSRQGYGWSATDAQPWVAEEAAVGRPEILVVALGNNDSMVLPSQERFGWSPRKLQDFRDLLEIVSGDTCIAVILPGHSAAYGAESAEQMDAARSDLRALAEERNDAGPLTVAVDWQSYIDADPSIIELDGMHLSLTPESILARSDAYKAAVRQCDDALDAKEAPTTTTVVEETTTTTATIPETTTTTSIIEPPETTVPEETTTTTEAPTTIPADTVPEA